MVAGRALEVFQLEIKLHESLMISSFSESSFSNVDGAGSTSCSAFDLVSKRWTAASFCSSHKRLIIYSALPTLRYDKSSLVAEDSCHCL